MALAAHRAVVTLAVQKDARKGHQLPQPIRQAFAGFTDRQVGAMLGGYVIRAGQVQHSQKLVSGRVRATDHCAMRKQILLPLIRAVFTPAAPACWLINQAVHV